MQLLLFTFLLLRLSPSATEKITISEAVHTDYPPSKFLANQGSLYPIRLFLHSVYSFLLLSNGTSLFKDIHLLTSHSTIDKDGVIGWKFTRENQPETIVEWLPRSVFEIDSSPHLDGGQTIFRKLPYILSNPSLKKPHYDRRKCSKEPFNLAFRVQTEYIEAGLPVTIQCSTCKEQAMGLPTFFQVLPERDFTQSFLKMILSNRKVNAQLDYCEQNNCEGEPRVTPLLPLIMNLVNKAGDYFHLPDHIARWAGEQATTTEHRILQGIPNGELYINTPMITIDGVKYLPNWFGTNGLTTSCAVELDGELIGSNVFMNTDFIGTTNDSTGSDLAREFRYSDYETISIPTIVYSNWKENIEIFVSWQDWSCCSACCCPASICGNYETASDCESVFSSKSRKGYVSVRRAHPGPIKLDVFTGKLEDMLRIEPYLSEGMPIQSTLFIQPSMKDARKFFLNKFTHEYNKTTKQYYKLKSGIVIESASCKSDEQKLDCAKWAKCRGIELGAAIDESIDEGIDSCSTVHYVEILVGFENIRFGTIKGENLRIRMDPEAHNMHNTTANWRINLRKPKKYNANKDCHVQKVIEKNNEILINGIEKVDM